MKTTISTLACFISCYFTFTTILFAYSNQNLHPINSLIDTLNIEPKLTVLGVENTCDNDCISIPISLEGTPPFDLYFSVKTDEHRQTFYQLIETKEDAVQFCLSEIAYYSNENELQLNFLRLADATCVIDLDTSLNLDVLKSSSTEIERRICSDEQIIVNGTVYDKDNLEGREVITGGGQNGCDSVVIVSLEYNKLSLDLGEDITTLAGDNIQLNPTLNRACRSVFWTSSDGQVLPDELNIIVQPNVTTTYTLTITDIYACSESDSITISITDERKVYIPNVFSPNYDGFNDVFTIYGSHHIKTASIQVFDSYGSLIYEIIDTPRQEIKGWDGTFAYKAASVGVYIYQIELEFIDGVRETFRGTFNLMR